MEAIKEIKSKISSSPSFGNLAQLLEKEDDVFIAGSTGAFNAFIVNHVRELLGSHLFCITPDLITAEKLRDDLEEICGSGAVHFFPTLEKDPGRIDIDFRYNNSFRAASLKSLSTSADGQIVIAPLKSILEKITPKSKFKSKSIFIKRGNDCDYEKLISQLLEMGYIKEYMVERPMEMSVRGGIVDLFPNGEEFPVRIEFFGNTVDSIRFFNPETQKSIRKLSSFLIVPEVEINPPSPRLSPEDTILGYLSSDTAVIFVEVDRIKSSNHYLKAENFNFYRRNSSDVLSQEFLDYIRKFKNINIYKFHSGTSRVLNINVSEQLSFNRNIKLLRSHLKRLVNQKFNQIPHIYILCENEEQRERLDLLIDIPECNTVRGSLSSGFTYREVPIHVFTDH
ncbi:MAG: hypothetical protein ACE5QV_08475, partial [Fidelibacterota bacterium]